MCIHMISLKNVSKSFDKGQHLAVKDISLHIREGETLVLLGSSGCGKTTLLKLINRLLDPTSGTIEMDGKDITGLDPIALKIPKKSRRCMGSSLASAWSSNRNRHRNIVSRFRK